jgi:hypothetical protein
MRIAARRLDGGMAHANLFLVRQGGAIVDLLCEHLQSEFSVRIFDMELPSRNGTDDPATYRCLAIDSSRPETVRDAIKERLWPARRKTPTSGRLSDILHGRHEKTSGEFRLREYGFFIPCRTRRFADIRVHSFAHRPAYYRYRLALARTTPLPEPMADFLHALFADCPNHLFNQPGVRASRVCRSGLDVEIPLRHVGRHDIITLATRSRDHSTVNSRHENLQKFFLQHDRKTVACEVPVWMEAWEFADYARFLNTRESLTGHIDVLRHEENGLLGVWDYKPRARAERSAHVQVFLYALMLSLRTGLPLSHFLCGYFDETDAYTFHPTLARLT